jgi:hypothetical protein
LSLGQDSPTLLKRSPTRRASPTGDSACNGTGPRVPKAPRHSRGRSAARGPVPLAPPAAGRRQRRRTGRPSTISEGEPGPNEPASYSSGARMARARMRERAKPGMAKRAPGESAWAPPSGPPRTPSESAAGLPRAAPTEPAKAPACAEAADWPHPRSASAHPGSLPPAWIPQSPPTAQSQRRPRADAPHHPRPR